MYDRLDAATLDEAPDQGLIADIAFDELGLSRHRPGQAGREVVEHDRLLAGIEQLERHVATDVPSSARHKNAHSSDPFLAEASQAASRRR